jgi:hypothetical protein
MMESNFYLYLLNVFLKLEIVLDLFKKIKNLIFHFFKFICKESVKYLGRLIEVIAGEIIYL